MNPPTKTIYVRLLEEGSVAWRPVVAIQLRDSTYEIADQPYDRNDEVWEFEPRAIVECETRMFDGTPRLVAVRRTSRRGPD